jgi:peptidoglycan L-alanyl-D-glutamate endopeptidase CwlK
MDQISLDRIAQLHPKVREEVKKIFEECVAALGDRVDIRISQGLRTIAEQDALYALGRTVVNPQGRTAKRPFGQIVTNAKGGSSYHNYGLAVDFVLLVDDKASWDTKSDWDGDKVSDWMEVVKIFAKYEWDWGGNWTTTKDYPHFDKKFGHTITDLKNKYNKKDFIKGTQYVNI